MPQKTIQDLDAYIKATAVVYDHSNTKLVSRKTKVSRRRKEAFLSVLPYRKPSSHYHSHERRTSSLLNTRKPRSKTARQSSTSNPKQKLKISVQTPQKANEDAPQTLSFRLDPRTSVQSLKELIEKQIGIEARYQCLHNRRNFQLCDLLTLEENGVNKDEIIFLRLSKDDQTCDDVPKGKANIDDEYLKDLSSKIESSWKELAKHLGYEEAEIADIQTTNEDSTEESRHMLLTWWEKTTDRDEAAQKLRRALEAIGLTDLTQNVPVTSESKNEVAGPEPERRHDAGVDEESKQNEAASTDEEKLKKEQVCDQDKPRLICRRYVQIFIRSNIIQKPTILCLQVNPETSVLTLKVIVKEKIGVHPQQQRLYIRRNFRNFELHNLLTLHDCGIHQDENISLRLCTDGLLGGGPKDKHPVYDAVFRDLASKTESCWEELAKHLGYEEAEIKQFQTTFTGDKERSLQMLLAWWRKQTNREEGFQTLRVALNSIGRAQLALMMPSDEQQRAKQQERGQTDKRLPEFQEGVAKEQSKRKGSKSSEGRILVQKKVGNRDTPQHKEKVEGAKEQSEREGNTSAESQIPGQEEVGNQNNPQPEVQVGGANETSKQVGTTSSEWRPGQEEAVHRDKPQPLVQVGGAEETSEQGGATSSEWRLGQGEAVHQDKPQPLVQVGGAKETSEQGGTTSSEWRPGQEEAVHRDKPQPLVQVGGAKETSGQGGATSSEWRPGQEEAVHRDKPQPLVQVGGAKETREQVGTTSSEWRPGQEEAVHRDKPQPLVQVGGAKETSEQGGTTSSEWRPGQEEAVHRDKPQPLVQVGGAKETSEQGGTTSSEWRPGQEEVGHRDKPKPENTVEGTKKKSRQGRTTSSERQRPGQEDDLLSVEFIESFFTTNVHVSGNDNVKTLLFLLKHVAEQKKLSGVDNLARVRSITFDSCNLSRLSEVVALHLTTMKNLHELDFDRVTLSGSNVAQLLSVLNASNLTTISFKRVPLGGSAKDWAVQLQGIKSFATLRLSQCRLNLRDVKDIASSIEEMPNLANFNISINEEFNERDWHSAGRMIPHQTFDMSHCGINSRDAEHITESVSCDNGLRLSIAGFSLTGGDMAVLLQSFRMRDLVSLSLVHIEGLGGSADIWTPALQNLQELCELDISCCSLQSSDIEHLAAASSQMQNLADLNLSGNSSLEGKAETWVASLQRMIHLKKLHMRNGSINSRDMEYIAQLVGCMGNLVDCDCTDDWEGLHWRVEPCDNGIQLSIDRFALTGEDMADVLKSFSNRTDLVSLNLDGIDGLGGSASIWTPFLQNLTTLQQLHLISCSLQSTDFEHLDAALSQLPNLAVLNFSGNSNLGGNAGTLVPSLQRMIHLKRLDMRNSSINSRDVKYIAELVIRIGNLVDCDFSSYSETWSVKPSRSGIRLSIKSSSLTSEDVADILQSFSYRSDLVSLNLHGVPSLGGSAGIWTPPLQNLTELCEFDLINCSLQSADIEHLATALSQIPNLAALNLSENPNLGGKAGWWAASLQSAIHLKSLKLWLCDINMQDTLCIAASVGKMPNMADLTLSSKELRGGAWMWAASLQSMTHLLKLDMSDECIIGGGDVKYIAESVSRMENLVDCHFSGRWGGFHVQPCNNSIGLRIEWSSLTSEDVAHMLQSFSNRRYLVSLKLHGVSGLGGSACIWAPPLQNLTELRELDLIRCSLQSADIEHLATALSQIPNLADLNLSLNLGLGGNAKTWAASLQLMVHLESLDLSLCDINDQEIPHIISSVGKMPNLADLNVSRNMGLVGKTGMLTASLQSLLNLKSLDLSSRYINEADQPHALSLVGKMPNLADLNLSSNRGLGCNISMLAASLQGVVRLKSLDLSSCCINKQDIPHIASSVAELPNVSEVKLSGNSDLGGNAETWAASLQSMVHLKSLDLSSCDIQDQDMPHIASSVGRMLNLAELNLSGSKGLSCKAETWAASLPSMIHLKSLNLSSCGIYIQDMRHIASLVAEMPNLAALHLSGNRPNRFHLRYRNVGGNARTLTTSLQRMIHLKSLDLSSCFLNEQDIPHIASSVGKMPNLADLNLSENDDMGHGSAGTWAAMQFMIHLKKLDMRVSNVNVQDTNSLDIDVKQITEAVSRMENLVDFDFSYGSNVEVCRVQPCDNGIRLSIEGFLLTGNDVADIVQTFSNRRDLVSLILRDIHGLGGSAALWSLPLQNHTHLKELRLTHCSLMNTDIEPLAAAVSGMPTVQSLSLVGNRSLGGSAKTWAPSLTQMEHVRSLKLGRCALTEEDKKHISKAWISGVDFESSKDD